MVINAEIIKKAAKRCKTQPKESAYDADSLKKPFMKLSITKNRNKQLPSLKAYRKKNRMERKKAPIFTNCTLCTTGTF